MKCEECKFYAALGSQCRKKLVTGLANTTSGVQVLAGFPVVRPSDWCGEFRERDN